MKKNLMIILILISTISLFSVINKINEYTTNGFSHSLYIDNEKAFIADGSKLLILDIADPVNIIECSDFQLPVASSWIVDVFVENNIAYVVDRHNGLFIVDVSDTSNPQLIGEYLCSNLLKVIKHENIVILKFNYRSFIQFVDISDLTSPIYLYSYTINEDYLVSAIEVYSSIAYVTCIPYDIPNTISKVFMLDFNMHNQPDILNEIDIDDRIHHFKVFDSIAILSGSDIMRFYDLIDPINPMIISSFNYSIIFDGSLSDYYSTDNTLLLSSWNADVQIYDISDIYNPQLLSYYYNGVNKNSIFQYYNDLLYCIDDGDGLIILDLTSIENHELVKWFDTQHKSENFILENDILYFSSGHIYNILDITSPILLGQLGSSGNCIEKYGNYLIQGGYGNLKIYDISIPSSPEITSQLSIYNIQSIKVINNTMCCLHHNYETNNSYLKIIDIIDPTNPTIISSTLMPSMGCDFVIEGDFAYIASQEGIVIVNIGYSLNPSIVSSLTTNAQSVSLIKENDYLFVSDINSIKVININQPQNPILSSTITPHNNSYISTKPMIHNDNLYFVDNNWNEILQYDIFDEDDPVLLNSYKWNLPVIDWTMSNNMLITSNFYHGFSILDLDILTSIDQYNTPNLDSISNYPNPFNPSTTIEFSIPSTSDIELIIYNTKGQKIKTLANDKFTKGAHSIIWNGDNDKAKSVSSGVYLYKLNVNGKTKSVKKCLLLK